MMIKSIIKTIEKNNINYINMEKVVENSGIFEFSGNFPGNFVSLAALWIRPRNNKTAPFYTRRKVKPEENTFFIRVFDV